ncbi:MmoB/DmpM family protein [Pseudonocardia sp. WMMC193]|uniref:MmoB/DmpM family protein n=1 Tax=Pseudonocardia sp. WMMC193 TaxID=2911965 RepID=UPI001F2BFF9E|nr:MmoB/DmpM family protein [Pseudonocardia sp. WMMC193]MCF7550848.1 MmoB/DmpM family protein [Pseudonocardia sp. WMMC193]
MTTQPSTAKLVGPIMRGVEGAVVDAVIGAIEIDNPDSEVLIDDQGGYVRISVPDRCVLTRASLEEELGRSMTLSELEPALASFAGRVKQTDTEFVWYLERQD